MALKIKNYVTSYGVTYDELYYRIELISYDNTTKEFQYGGAAYVSEEAAKNGVQPIPGDLQFGDCIYNSESIKSDNLIEAAYKRIKYETSLIEGKTDEEIAAHNQQRVQECMALNIPPTGVWKSDYRAFIGAEDC